MEECSSQGRARWLLEGNPGAARRAHDSFYRPWIALKRLSAKTLPFLDLNLEYPSIYNIQHVLMFDVATVGSSYLYLYSNYINSHSIHKEYKDNVMIMISKDYIGNMNRNSPALYL